MMSVTINLGAWRSVFAVPSKVVDEGLKFSDGVKLKVLLYVLRNADKTLDNKDISACTGVNVTDIPEALDYWVSMGILQKDNQVYSPVNNSEKEISSLQEPVFQEPEVKETPIAEEIPAEPEKPHFTVTKPQKPDYVFTVQQLAVDEELKIIVSEAQTALGKTLSTADISTLLMLKDTCGLPLDVILMLIQYAISLDKGNMRTIERLGVSWANDGVNSVEEADNKIRLATQRTKCYSIVSSSFGLKNAGSPSKKQLDYCNTWVSEWKFSPDMLREAYERCVDTKGEMKFNYIDGILKRWHSNGIRNKNDLAQFENAKKKKEPVSAASSYDIEELEQINRLDDFE
ncbi:MAG: DnaD domain protein [Ruminococcus sp.]|nr:DnaD domain protein [Ruminococcus sp.]